MSSSSHEFANLIASSNDILNFENVQKGLENAVSKSNIHSVVNLPSLLVIAFSFVMLL